MNIQFHSYLVSFDLNFSKSDNVKRANFEKKDFFVVIQFWLKIWWSHKKNGEYIFEGTWE